MIAANLPILHHCHATRGMTSLFLDCCCFGISLPLTLGHSSTSDSSDFSRASFLFTVCYKGVILGQSRHHDNGIIQNAGLCCNKEHLSILRLAVDTTATT